MKFRDLHPAPSIEQKVQVWAHMSLDLFTHAVREAAEDMNVDALQAMLDGGAFDLEDLERHVDGDGMFVSQRPDRRSAPNEAPQAPSKPRNREGVKMLLWAERLHAFCAFAQNADLETQAVALPGLSVGEVGVSALRADAAFRAWFDGATSAVLTTFSKAIQSREAEHQFGVRESLRQSLSLWMGCACMLDAVDVVTRIHKTCDKAATRMFRMAVLQQDIAQRWEAGTMQLWVNPLFVALEFSSSRCLDFLDRVTEGGLRSGTVIGRQNEGHANGAKASSNIEMCDVLLGNPLRVHCDHATLARVTREVMLTPEGTARVLGLASESLRNKDARVPAFLEAGVYHLLPTQRAMQACKLGLPTMVNALVPHVTWSHVDPTTVRDAALAHLYENGQRHDLREDAIVAFVRGAFAHGGPEAMEHVFGMGTFSVVLKKNMERALLALLDTGAVRPHFAEFGDETAMEEARAAQSPLADVMASWLARRTAHALLDDMGLDGFCLRTRAIC